MLDIYICEDNEIQRKHIAAFISRFCLAQSLDAEVVMASSSPREIITHYETALNPSLFFLDIELDAEINGIELASLIREQRKMAAIVFLTSHAEMTFLTFQYKVEALDFIVKDNNDNVTRRIAECINTALERLAPPASTQTICVKLGEKVVSLDMSEIILIETTPVRHKLRIHLKNRTLECSAELKALEEKLDGRFIRCHRTSIINKNKIACFNKKEGTITMANKSICPVSRTKKREVFSS